MSILRWWNEPLEDPFDFPRTLAGFPFHTYDEPRMKMWRPTIDIRESANNYHLCAELPGVKKEDINIEYDNGVLTLSGQKKYEKVDEDEQFRRVERNYGEFKRVLTVGEIDPSQIKAKFKDGVLDLTIPKPREKEPETKKIMIQ